jgi:RNA polymerase sigma-70 factor (ECF subfamily)
VTDQPRNALQVTDSDSPAQAAAPAEAISFEAFLSRLREGDQDAAAELVREFEPIIRRSVHSRLARSPLAPVLDSADVCQSVLASFFTKVVSGQFDLGSSEDLLKLLVSMARYRLASHARRHGAQRRDRGRHQAGEFDASELAGADRTPSECVASAELLGEVQRRLSEDERRLMELRGEGRDWGEIAAELGDTPVTLRKRFSRALGRVARALGL